MDFTVKPKLDIIIDGNSLLLFLKLLLKLLVRLAQLVKSLL